MTTIYVDLLCCSRYNRFMSNPNERASFWNKDAPICTPPMDVWRVESLPAYWEFLAARNHGIPPHTGFNLDGSISKAPPGYVVERTMVMAEERDRVLHLGVKLSDGSEFWTPHEGLFPALLAHEVSIASSTILSKDDQARYGLVGDKDGHVPGTTWFPAWVSTIGGGQVVRLNYTSSHMGGDVEAVGVNGEKVVLQED